MIKIYRALPIRLALVSISLIILSSCGGIKTTSYFVPPKQRLQNFEGLEIEDLVTEIEDFPKEGLTEIPTKVAVLVSSKNKFKEVTHGKIENIPATDTLVLLGEVSEYRPSSDISFEGGGLKFGEVSVTIKLALLEKATGNEVSTGEVNGFSSLGFMAKDIYESLASEIVKFIMESY